MKKKLIFIILPIFIFLGLVIFQKSATKTSGETTPTQEKTIAVKIKKASDGKSLTKSISYPATVSADQQAAVTAKTSGTVVSLNFDLGKYVAAGSNLARIDDTGSNLNVGENSLRSSQVQQLEIAVRQAEESLKLAKKNEDEDSTPTTRTAEDVAKLQLENARIALASALDSHSVSAPISGKIVSRNVSLGDSVSTGQTIAEISKTGRMKASFFVEQEKIASFAIGQKVNLILSDGTSKSAYVSNIAPQADQTTKRFQVEAFPEDNSQLIAGTIITVATEQTLTAQAANQFILPLSAVTVAQNENYIFIANGDFAKKVPVEIIKISGENIEVKADLDNATEIIIEGNKLLKDGSKIIKN